MLLEKVLGRARPSRKLDVVNTFAVLSDAQIQFHFIFQKVSIVHEKLWNQLFNIRWVCFTTFPFFIDSFKHTIRIIEAP